VSQNGKERGSEGARERGSEGMREREKEKETWKGGCGSCTVWLESESFKKS
jgi:hypothetical protein